MSSLRILKFWTKEEKMAMQIQALQIRLLYKALEVYPTRHHKQNLCHLQMTMKMPCLFTPLWNLEKTRSFSGLKWSDSLFFMEMKDLKSIKKSYKTKTRKFPIFSKKLVASAQKNTHGSSLKRRSLISSYTLLTLSTIWIHSDNSLTRDLKKNPNFSSKRMTCTLRSKRSNWIETKLNPNSTLRTKIQTRNLAKK